MLKELKPGLRMMVILTILTGFIYPAVVTVLSQMLFRDKANGSLIVNGSMSGSATTVNSGGILGGSGTVGSVTVMVCVPPKGAVCASKLSAKMGNVGLC
jgi:hypothetical protein